MFDMDTLASRLATARIKKGWDQPTLGKEAGRYTGKPLSKQVISAIEGGRTKEPSRNTIKGLAFALGIDEQFLLTGKSSKPASSANVPDQAPDPFPVQVSTRDIAPGYVRLPLLNMEGDMGPGVHSDDPIEVVQYLDVAEW